MTRLLPANHPDADGDALYWREQQAAERASRTEELRGHLRTALIKAAALAEELAEEKAHGPADPVQMPALSDSLPAYTKWVHHDPEELAEHINEWLRADWCKAYSADVARFEEESE